MNMTKTCAICGLKIILADGVTQTIDGKMYHIACYKKEGDK